MNVEFCQFSLHLLKWSSIFSHSVCWNGEISLDCISTHLVFEYGIKFAFLKLSPFNSDIVSFSCIAALNLLMFCWYYLHLCSQNILFCRLIFLLYLFMIFVILATKSWELLQLMTFPKRLHRTSIILCSLNSVKNNHWLYLGLICVCVFVFF